MVSLEKLGPKGWMAGLSANIIEPAFAGLTNNNFGFTMEKDMDFRSALLLSSLTLFVATPALAMKSAAPDAGGYSYIDNHEVGGPTYNFEDISATGNPLVIEKKGAPRY